VTGADVLQAAAEAEKGFGVGEGRGLGHRDLGASVVG